MTRHATLRAFERHGLVIGETEKAELLARIGSGKGVLLKVYDHGSRLWRVKWRGRNLGVVLSQDGAVVTVMGRAEP